MANQPQLAVPRFHKVLARSLLTATQVLAAEQLGLLHQAAGELDKVGRVELWLPPTHRWFYDPGAVGV